MEKKYLIPLLFITYNIFIIIGAFMIISGISGSSILMILGFVTHISFLIATIREISNSKSIQGNTKLLWYIALIIAPTIAGLFYLISARKNINNQTKLIKN